MVSFLAVREENRYGQVFLCRNSCDIILVDVLNLRLCRGIRARCHTRPLSPPRPSKGTLYPRLHRRQISESTAAMDWCGMRCLKIEISVGIPPSSKDSKITSKAPVVWSVENSPVFLARSAGAFAMISRRMPSEIPSMSTSSFSFISFTVSFTLYSESGSGMICTAV